jgi:hypothetical protein
MALYACSDCGTARSDQVGSACPNCGNVLEQKIERGPKPQFAGYSGLASLRFVRAFRYGWIGCFLVGGVLNGVSKMDTNVTVSVLAETTAVLASLGWPICITLWVIGRRRRKKMTRAYHAAVADWETGGMITQSSPPNSPHNIRRVFGVVRNVDSDSSGGGGDFSGMG